MRRLLPAVLLLSVGCSSPSDVRWGAISFLTLGRQVDGVSNGYDLDGLTSEEDGSDGCGIGDYTTPDGMPGVDNALARVIPALEATEASALEPLINQNINLGEVLMLFGVAGLDDPMNDDEVSVTFVRGFGAPIVGADGRIVSGQTFERDLELDPVTVETGSIVDGVLEASGVDVTFPIEIFDATPVLDVQNVSLHFEYDERGDFKGYLGGALNYQRILDGVEDANIDGALRDTLPLLFSANSDLDSDDGECSRMSATIEFDGVNAYLFDPPEGLE